MGYRTNLQGRVFYSKRNATLHGGYEMNLVRTEKVYEKKHECGLLYYLHEVESGGHINCYLTIGSNMGTAWMPGRIFERDRVTYTITSDFEIKEVSRKPSLDELSAHIRLIAQKLVDTKTCVEVLEVECAHCNGDNFAATFLLRYGARPLKIGCGDTPDYLSRFVIIDDDDGLISEVLDKFSVLDVERIDETYMRELQLIEEWLNA